MLTRVTNMVRRQEGVSSTRLRIIPRNNQAPFEVQLPPVGVVLGADAGSDVHVDDPAVSRRHASVAPVSGGFEINDLSSRNGTWVDGVAITRAVVPVGTTFRIGSTIVQVLPSEESISVPPSAANVFGAMLGGSLAMRSVFGILERASMAQAPALLLGESGTGKELAARALHEQGARKGGPFVVFDCGAASDTLVESELFGHKRGAFTGAIADKPGAFALAHGGTLFLDEIGDLPLNLQPKLLRMLERGEVTPLGARKSETYDVRFVAATHRDLWDEVARGTFRGDLYYRLAVVEVHLPPLRARTEDVPFLVQQFLKANGAAHNDVAGPALDRLMRYQWPGNVRELRNVIARAVALAAPKAAFADMPIVLRPSAASAPKGGPLATADVSYHDAKAALIARFEREYLTDLLRRSGENLSLAARTAGLERKYLYRVLERNAMLPARLKDERIAAESDDES